METFEHVGRNIRVLRRAKGMTLAQLSERIGIQPGPLGNIERLKNLPSSRVVMALCEALDVGPEAIFAHNPEDRELAVKRELESPFRADLDGSLLTPKIRDTARFLVDSYLALEDICRAQKSASIPLHIPLERSEAGMEKLSDRVREFMRIRSGVVFDYFELFETFGFRVTVLRLPAETESFSYYDPGNYNAFFFVNSEMNPEKQLFRLAYELGHIYLLTARLLSPKRAIAGELDARHSAAKFAAFFLMPADAVCATVRQLGIRNGGWSYELLLRIKHRFGVSAESFLYRLNELKLIDPDISDKLKKRIHRHYSKTNFREPDDTRRILTPNGRLWDLLLTARERKKDRKEVLEIETRLKKLKIEKK